MTGKYILILLTVFFISLTVNAQSNSNDIQSIVKNQIEAARAKAQKEQQSITKKELLNKKEVSPSPAILSIYSFGVLSLFVIAGAASFRLYKKQQVKKQRIVKQGVLMMRHERVIPLENPEKSYIRQKLARSPYSANAKGADITKLAKALNISQGEVLLAKKITVKGEAPFNATVSEHKKSISNLSGKENEIFGKHLRDYLKKKQNIDTEKLIYLN